MYTPSDKRPRFLSLTAFKFPLNAKLSALHRISGLMLIASLIGFLALMHLIVLHPLVTINSISDHCITNCLVTIFWSTITFHWLTGLRHLLAEHFTLPNLYQLINSDKVSYLLIALWLVITLLIFNQAFIPLNGVWLSASVSA